MSTLHWLAAGVPLIEPDSARGRTFCERKCAAQPSMAMEHFTSLHYTVDGALAPSAAGISRLQANFGQRAGNQVRVEVHCGNAPAKP